MDCQYDSRSRRTQKIVSTWNGSSYVAQSTNKFVYDGWNLVAILDHQSSILYSFNWGTDASGTMQGAGGVGGLISMTVHQGTNAGTYFYCYDGNHNGATLVNATNGAIEAVYELDAFLRVLRATGRLAFVNPFVGSTKFCDWETGLLYYGYRYYDPDTGRWPNRDPMGEEGGLNLYGYVGNNPVNEIDPLGLTWSSNWNFFWDWATGGGGNNRNYNNGSTESGEMQNSPGGQAMRDKFYKGGCKDFKGGNYGTGQAAWDTLVNPSTADWSGTGAQVGGFGGATATDNGNGTVTFNIPNVAGTHSFFYHAVPDRSSPTGPGRNIKQNIQWTEPIDKSKCKCPNK